MRGVVREGTDGEWKIVKGERKQGVGGGGAAGLCPGGECLPFYQSPTGTPTAIERNGSGLRWMCALGWKAACQLAGGHQEKAVVNLIDQHRGQRASSLMLKRVEDLPRATSPVTWSLSSSASAAPAAYGPAWRTKDTIPLFSAPFGRKPRQEEAGCCVWRECGTQILSVERAYCSTPYTAQSCFILSAAISG